MYFLNYLDEDCFWINKFDIQRIDVENNIYILIFLLNSLFEKELSWIVGNLLIVLNDRGFDELHEIINRRNKMYLIIIIYLKKYLNHFLLLLLSWIW